MELSRQKYWSWLPFPSPGDLPDPGIKPASPESPVLAGAFFTTEPPGKLFIKTYQIMYIKNMGSAAHKLYLNEPDFQKINEK